MQSVNISIKNSLIYALGMVLIAVGVTLVVRSHMGVSPWDTLHVAIDMATPITLGYATIVVASLSTLIVLIIRKHWRFLLMLIPIFIVGNLIDLFNLIIFENFHPEAVVIRGLLFISALLMMPLGGALLIASTYPAGVFDELMLALMKVFKTSRMARLRIMLDFSVMVLAVMITLSYNQTFGSLQVGTFVFILSVGPLLKWYLKLYRRHFMELNKFIDHTYLKPFGTKEDIDQLLDEAITHNFMSVCINPSWVEYAAESLKRSEVLVCTVVGFPLGASTSRVKVLETEDALKNGADEIDMVLNVGWVKAGKFDAVEEEIAAIKATCGDTTLKVILETCYLTNEEIRYASQAAFKAGADFVKTSTGFGSGGATLEAVKIMADVAQGKGVKASGGIKNSEDFNQMIEAGATRIGTSSGVSLIKGETNEEDY